MCFQLWIFRFVILWQFSAASELWFLSELFKSFFLDLWRIFSVLWDALFSVNLSIVSLYTVDGTYFSFQIIVWWALLCLNLNSDNDWKPWKYFSMCTWFHSSICLSNKCLIELWKPCFGTPFVYVQTNFTKMLPSMWLFTCNHPEVRCLHFLWQGL